MPIGAFTGQFDLALLLVILFVLFFFCLVYYLHQEDKREGYPLVSHRTTKTGGRVEVVGFPGLPKPKVFHLPHGRPDVYAPRREEDPPIDARNVGNPNGMPIEPNGDPLLSGTGAASWVAKIDEPDLSHDGHPVFIRMSEHPAYRVMKGDPDPRGFPVAGLDEVVAGTVADVWIDRAEHYAKFVDVELADGAGRVLLPMEFAAVNGRRRTVRTAAITAAQFARVPRQKDAAIITAREENQIRGYYGGGLRWAIPSRAEPLL